MSSEISFNQSNFDEIVAVNENKSLEARVENLENEVAEIKGSVKALLIDIRETMGVLENPFQDIQGIANISSAVVTATSKNYDGDELKPEEVNDQCKKEELDSQIEEANLIKEKEEVKGEVKGEVKEEVKENESGDIGMELGENTSKSYVEHFRRAAKILPERPDSKLIDPMSFYKTIIWSKNMVEKYDYESIKELVEVFYLLGYVPEDMKEIILKLTEILHKTKDLDGAVIDLYKLYHILNPDDESLDSDLLDYMLSKDDMVKTIWQRK